MLVVGLLEEGRVLGQHPLQIKGAHIEDAVQVDIGVLGADDVGGDVDGAQSALDVGQPFGADQVDFVQDHPVGEGDLFDGFVLDPLRFDLIEVVQHMRRVDDRHDGIQSQLIADLVVDEESLGHRSGIGQTRCLDEDLVEPIAPAHQRRQDPDQVPANRATNAPVIHLEDLLLGVEDERVVDSHLTELVLDHRDPLPVLLAQDPVHQRRLPGAEEAGDHRHRYPLVSRGRHGRFLLGDR